MKKWVLIASIAIFVLPLSATSCFSQLDRTVTNTSKKGSLLIWPLIKVGAAADTTVLLTNNYYESVKVKCAYRSAFPFQDTSWSFNLMADQTISWRASTGKSPDGKSVPRTAFPGYAPDRTMVLKTEGNFPRLNSGTSVELRCWAVDSSVTQQIAWNWLSGEAIIKEGKGQWGYSSWRFAVNSSTTGASAGTAGQIQLTGDSGNYDACPTGLMFNFLKQTPSTAKAFPKGTVNSVLTLVSCMEDYVANTAPAVFTGLLTYDEAQSSVSGASICVGSNTAATQWFSEPLISSKLVLATNVANPFTNLATPGGSIYIHGKQDSRCAGSSGVPLIGVMSMQFMSGTGPVTGVPPTATGPGQAYVKDASDVNTATPISIHWQ